MNAGGKPGYKKAVRYLTPPLSFKSHGFKKDRGFLSTFLDLFLPNLSCSLRTSFVRLCSPVFFQGARETLHSSAGGYK